MSSNIKDLELQAHLAEYVALRDEMLSLIKWKDKLIFISLGITGALFSFVFSRDLNAGEQHSNQAAALYLITPLASLVGGLWISAGFRILRLGNYLREVTSLKINALLNSGEKGIKTAPEISALEWENSTYRVGYKWQRRVIDWTIYVATFVISGTLAQLLILRTNAGTVCAKLQTLEFPFVYWANWFFIILFFGLFAIFLIRGKDERGRSLIRESI